jgi:signal transduction histidine kinase
MLQISVRDSGPGISPENLVNLFQNFGESQGATASKYGGTGLGLALSQKLCRLMGGDIEVTSELGKGSCFTLKVPTRLKSNDAHDPWVFSATEDQGRPAGQTDTAVP